MEHHFNTEVAEKYGVEEAVILYNIAYWLKHNKANDKNYHDGYYWTFNSARAFEELFPYFNSKKISRMLNKLESLGAIKSGNYNKIAYDRTKWYTIVDAELIELYKLSKDKNENCISQNCLMEDTKMENGLTENEQTIPYNNTDIKTEDNKTTNNTVVVPAFKQEIDMLIRANQFNITSEKLLQYAEGDSKLVIKQLKTYASKGLRYVISAIKNKYVVEEKKTDPVDEKKEFFKKYKSNITILEVAYRNNKLEGQKLEWAEQLLREEGRI